MRKLTSIVLVLALAAFVSPVSILAQQAQTGGISGTATTANGQRIANARVQIVDANGNVVSTTTTRANGSFSTSGLNPGNYTVQVLGPNGAIVGTSAAVTVTAGAVATGVAITATAAAITAAGLSAVTIGAIVIGGAAVGVTALVIANNDDSSPSR